MPQLPPPQLPSPISELDLRTGYTFLKWDVELAIMLVDWCDAHHMSSSSSARELDQRNGDTHWWDKASDEWKEGYELQLETTAGLKVGQEYEAFGTEFRHPKDEWKPRLKRKDAQPV